MSGKVFLVGAGPGDVGLITVKGLEAIKQAEVILYDRLANPKLLEYIQDHCELIYCGKLPDRHTLRQEGINDLLVKKALEGKTVVRLKGGDPGVFGRVGEEAEALAKEGIPYEMIPGISSGMAAPLYAGIPVTHREYGETFAIVTAHNKSRDGKPVLDWKALANGLDTIAFYMGVANLPYICQNLIENGKSPQTPVILIQWGTYSRQKTLEGTLETISELATAQNFSNPAITLVGEIVSLRKKMNWFEKKPLFGKQILLARTGFDSSGVANALSEQGADVIEFPKWKRKEVLIDSNHLSVLSNYEEILFTSTECVEEFFKILVKEKIDIRNVRARLYGISKKTIHALMEKGFIAEAFDKMFPHEKLLVVGDQPMWKYQYEPCDFFQTHVKVIDESYMEILEKMLSEATPDTIIFPSSQSVQMFFEHERVAPLFSSELIKNIHVVCMGEQTESALEFYGIHPNAKPSKPTRQDLVNCIQELS
jgi:uroporphyrinogen III methyltransferase / synthase